MSMIQSILKAMNIIEYLALNPNREVPLREIADALEDDLLAMPRVKFVESESDEYKVKAKKIVDLRENFD